MQIVVCQSGPPKSPIGDRVTFEVGMPVFDSFGAVIGRINVEFRCVVEDQFDSPFPDGIAAVAIDPTSIPDQCIDPLQAGSRHRKPGQLALVRLSLYSSGLSTAFQEPSGQRFNS